MATKIFEEINIETQGGTELVIRPLTIKALRKFMDKMSSLTAGDEDVSEEEGLDIMFEAAMICILQSNKNADPEALEDELDYPTINKILEVSAGVKVDDPNLLATQAR